MQRISTRRARTFALLTTLAVAVTGLAATPGPAGAVCPTAPNGTWVGTWNSDDGLYNGTQGGTLTWGPTAVAGTMTFITGTLALNPNTSFGLTVSCGHVTGSIPGNYGSIAIDASLSADGTQLAGTYQNSILIPGAIGHFRSSISVLTVADTGTNLSTDAGNTGATAATPLQTAITSPNPGALQIDEAIVPGSVVGGYSILNQVVQITAPDATATTPLAFTFELDASVTGGLDAASVAVFRNGARLTDCTGPAGVASPDPCVSAREDLPGGNVRISVLTSHASIWTLGVPAKTVSVGSAAVAEGNTGKPRTISFPLTLSTPSSTAVHVSWSIHDNGSATSASGDYKARAGTLTFNPSKKTGLTNTTAFVTTTVLPDTNPEADEHFAIDITGVDNGFVDGVGEGIGTILSDDADPAGSVSVGDVSVAEGDSGTLNSGKVVIELADPATSIQTVRVTIVDDGATAGVDYKPVTSRLLTFNIGQWQKFVAIGARPDRVVEGDERVAVVVTPVTPGTTVVRGTGHLTILNDD